MSIEYKYKIWRNIFTLCQRGQWYTIDPNRPDKEDFIEAVKDFIQQWGCAELSSDFSSFRRTDPLDVINEMLSFTNKRPERKIEAASYGDFYTKSYSDSEMKTQNEFWDQNNPSDGVLPHGGASILTNKDNASTGLKSGSTEELELG